MFQNSKAIVSSHNGGHARYLGILMDPTFYTTDSGGIAPMDPGDYPCLAAMATACQKEEALVHHKCKLQDYHKYVAIVVCCHNQLQKAIHEGYLAEVEDAYLNLAQKSPKKYLTMSLLDMPRSPFPCKTIIAGSLSNQWNPTNCLRCTSNAKKNARALLLMQKSPSPKQP